MRAANPTRCNTTANKRTRRVVLALALGIATPQAHPQSLTQPTATISGYVTDPSGANVPNAVIRLECSDGITAYVEAATDVNGHFSIAARPGQYILKITSPGFRNYNERLDLATGNPIKRTVVLQIATGGGITVFREDPPIEIIQISLTSTLPLNSLPPLKLHKRIAR
jgi:hypothetical protein